MGGRSYSGYIEGGRGIDVGDFTITPLMSLQYTHLDLEDYTETGAGALNLSVDEQNYDSLWHGVGMKIAYPINIQAKKNNPRGT